MAQKDTDQKGASVEDIEALKRQLAEVEAKLSETEGAKAEVEAKLSETEGAKAEVEAKLSETESAKAEVEAELAKAAAKPKAKAPGKEVTKRVISATGYSYLLDDGTRVGPDMPVNAVWREGNLLAANMEAGLIKEYK